MEVMNIDSNIINPAYEVDLFYNVNCRLTLLIYGSWSIGDLEAKFFRMGGSHWTILVDI